MVARQISYQHNVHFSALSRVVSKGGFCQTLLPNPMIEKINRTTELTIHIEIGRGVNFSFGNYDPYSEEGGGYYDDYEVHNCSYTNPGDN